MSNFHDLQFIHILVFEFLKSTIENGNRMFSCYWNLKRANKLRVISVALLNHLSEPYDYLSLKSLFVFLCLIFNSEGMFQANVLQGGSKKEKELTLNR